MACFAALGSPRATSTRGRNPTTTAMVWAPGTSEMHGFRMADVLSKKSLFFSLLLPFFLGRRWRKDDSRRAVMRAYSEPCFIRPQCTITKLLLPQSSIHPPLHPLPSHPLCIPYPTTLIPRLHQASKHHHAIPFHKLIPRPQQTPDRDSASPAKRRG